MKQPSWTPVREDVLARAFHGSSEGLAVARLSDGRILDVNDAMLRLLGRGRAELLGASLVDLDAAVSTEIIPGGEEPLVLVRANGSLVDQGPRYHELREAEFRYRALVEQLPAIIYTEVDDPGSSTGLRTVFVSPQTSALLGVTPDELLADNELWYRLVHPEDRAMVVDAEAEVERSGEPFAVEYRMLSRDGTTRWFRDESLLVADPSTGTDFWHGVMLDITEEKRAQEEARAAERRYRNLVETLPAVVYIDVMDDISTNLYTSSVTSEMLGYTPEDWIDDPELWIKMLHEEDRDRVMEAQTFHLEHGGPFDQEYRVLAKDGRIVWIRDVGAVVYDDDGRPLYAQGFMLDITDRKVAENALREALRREHEAARRLKALDGLKNTLLHTLSHDLRSPLTGILGTAALLLQQDLRVPEEERRELLEGVGRQARKIDRLLTDILDLDRLDRGIVEPKRQPVDVGALVRDLVSESELRGRSIEVQAPEAVMSIDGPKVERIVDNLLTNAAKHTPRGTFLWVRVEPREDGVLIAVEDDGPGVPDERKKSIFEPFNRGGEEGSNGVGTGIGLSLVARFAELHGGRAWVEDRPGGGASFRVHLPDPADAAENRRPA